MVPTASLIDDRGVIEVEHLSKRYDSALRAGASRFLLKGRHHGLVAPGE
jgi:hypothetical protein